MVVEYAAKSIDKAVDDNKLSGLVALIIFCFVFIKLFIVTLRLSKLAGAEFITSLIFVSVCVFV